MGSSCSNVKYVFHQIIYKIPYIDVCNIYSDFRFLDNYIYLRTIEDMYMVRGIAFDLILVTVDLVDKIDPKIMYEIKLQLTPEGEVFFYEP